MYRRESATCITVNTHHTNSSVVGNSEQSDLLTVTGRRQKHLFSDEPFDYMERGPFSYADPVRIKGDLLAGGFSDVEIEVIELSSRLNSRDAAQALVFGSPLRSEIERRDPLALDRAAEAVALAVESISSSNQMC